MRSSWSTLAGSRRGSWKTTLLWRLRGHWYFRHNTAHNNRGDGFNFNDPIRLRDTPSEGVVSYSNGGAALDHHGSGETVLAHVALRGTLVQRASAAAQENLTMGGFHQLRIAADAGPAIRVTELQRRPELVRAGTEIRTHFQDCSLTAARGHPKVLIQDGAYPWRAHFERCALTPEDIRFSTPIPAGLEGTSVLITHEDGRRWEIAVRNRTRVVSLLR
jgi:hypothetical protein